MRTFYFTFEDGALLTDSWHDGGILIVKADTIEQAQADAKVQLPRLLWEFLKDQGEVTDYLICPDNGCC